MARFAIVRQDGEVDKVEGVSVDDVANRYGWPGNGTIEAWDEGAHNDRLRETFSTPEQQREYIASLDGKPKGKASKAADTDEGKSAIEFNAAKGDK